MNNETPLISVLVVVRNSGCSIARTLQSILKQDIDNYIYEIIVVDGASTDDTREVIQGTLKESRAGWRLLDNPGEYLATGWNIGVMAAKGQYVIRVDAHAEVPTNFLRMNLEVMKEVDAACVGGPMETRGTGFWGRIMAGILSSVFGVGRSFRTQDTYIGYTDTVAYGMYKKDVLLEIGPFNEKMLRNQDYDLNRRMIRRGWRIYFDPRIRSIYYCVNRPPQFIKKAFSNGYWVSAVPTRAALRHLVPFFFVSSIILLTYLCSVRSGSNWYIYRPLRLYMILYFLMALFFSLDIAAKSDLRALIVSPLLYLSLHISYGLGTMYGLLTGHWYRVGRSNTVET